MNCRLCGGETSPKLALSPTPIANDFKDSPDLGAKTYPLELHQCLECEHVQLGHVIPGEVLYTNYKYETPKAMLPHLEKSAKDLKEKYPKAESVLEIGSNNGLNAEVLRKYFKSVSEVDPGGSSQYCVKRPFTRSLSDSYRGVDLIVANHVFAHIDDLNDVFEGVTSCLSEDGALVFEVQYFPRMVELGAFDMIYHEHRDYHTLKPLQVFARKHGLVLTHWEYVPIQGGSIRVTMRRRGREIEIPKEPLDWGFFTSLINENVEKVKRELSEHHRIIAFGAAAKACTLIHQCGIKDLIEYCVDDTPSKRGKYIPGTKIKILPVETLYQSKSDKTLFLTAWNYEEAIKSNHPDFKYVVPFT